MESELKFNVKIGTVSAVYPERHTARIVFEDLDDMVSDELPVLVSAASKNNFYILPDVGESVVCIFLLNSAQEGAGFIIGSFYNDVNKPKVNNQEKCRLDFGDGSFFEFDRSSGSLNINCTGDIKINGRNIYLNS